MHSKFQGKEIVLLARTLAPELGKKERAIARFIENNPETLSTMCISDIADYLSVSVASITKVSKKLGFSGFHDLKLNIGRTRIAEESDFNDITVTDNEHFIHNVIESTFMNSIIALQESLSGLNQQIVRDVAALFTHLKDENKILLAGAGGSGALCVDFHHKLLKIGIIASVYQDAHLQQMAASLMKPGDILLAISHSGQTADIIAMSQLARQNQAHTICLTNYPNSPLSHVCEHAIVTAVRNNPITGENATTRIVHLNILDALFTIIASQRNKHSQTSLQKTRSAVLSKRLSG